MRSHHAALRRALVLLPLAPLAGGCDPDGAFMDNPHPQVKALLDWYGEASGDHYATTDVPPAGQGYQLGRQQGYLFDPAQPPPFPLDVAAVTGYWSASRGDYAITADPAWTPPGGGGDYVDTRLEGYLFTRGLAGTVPLYAWYGAATADSYQTTALGWHPTAAPPTAGYTYVATEGYLVRPDDGAWAPEARAVGMENMTANGVLASGTRPLLLVRGTVASGGVAWAHDLAYYDALVFGPARYSAVAYFTEVSNGRFTWTRAGAYDVTYDATATSIETSAQFAAPAVARAGFDFERYDADGDGLVEEHELGLLIVDNATQRLAASRYVGCIDIPGQDVDFCPQGVQADGQPAAGISAVGEEASFSTIVHELTHQLGAADLYGPNCNSQSATLMSCTIFPANDDRQIMHLDPWHKLQLGWVRPRMRSVLLPGSVERLAAPQRSSALEYDDESPLVFYDPRRGTSEYLIVEYRDPAVGAGVNYDDNVPGRGIYVWQVRHNRSLYPATVTDVDDPMMRPTAAVLVWGASTGRQGAPVPWTAADREITLRWQDGTDAGIRLTIGTPDPSGEVTVEWRPATTPLVPRIDAVTSTPARGGTFTIAGAFGVAPGSRRVVFATESGESELPVTGWTPYQLTVRVPADVRTGAGFLAVDVDRDPAHRSNQVNLVLD